LNPSLASYSTAIESFHVATNMPAKNGILSF
jgi:hypothetical protein